VWAKLIGTPWWVRQPVTALLLAPILVAPVPNVAHSASWAWGLVILGIYGLVFAALAAALPRPIECTYLAAFDRLSRSRWWHRMYSIALQPQRLWTSALVAIVAGMAIMPLLVVSDRPAPNCRTANAAITFTAARPNPLDTSLITPGAPRLSRYDAEKWMPSINRAMHDANITTPDQQAAFVAQIDEESGELEMVNESPWGLPRAQWNDEQAARDYFNNKYAYLNGNGGVTSGDGYNYRGRGILQITGKSNYMAVSGELYGDDRLVKDPDLLTEPDIAGAAVAAYWNQNNLNRFIPPGHPVTPQQFQDLGSTINTGHPGDVPNNATERVRYWELAKTALGIK
jgi:putative chitinase